MTKILPKPKGKRKLTRQRHDSHPLSLVRVHSERIVMCICIVRHFSKDKMRSQATKSLVCVEITLLGKLYLRYFVIPYIFVFVTYKFKNLAPNYWNQTIVKIK